MPRHGKTEHQFNIANKEAKYEASKTQIVEDKKTGIIDKIKTGKTVRREPMRLQAALKKAQRSAAKNALFPADHKKVETKDVFIM